MWFLPIGSENPTRKLPVLTISIIVLNVLIFLVTWYGGHYMEVLDKYAFVPAHMSIITIFTHQFLHGGWMHLIGNMWILWIFGINVEDLLGRIAFVPFYLACGLSAALLHAFVESFGGGGEVPTVGASGAIFGMLGAYFVLFPRSSILGRPMFFLFPLPINLKVSALFFLGLYVMMEVVNGMQSLVSSGVRIAHWAHIGGFIFGAGSLFLLIATRAVIVPNIEKVRKGKYATINAEDVFLGKLEAALENGRVSAIPDEYRTLLAKQPRVVFAPETQMNIARSVQKAGDIPLCADAYRRMLECFPGHPAAHRSGVELAKISAGFFKDRPMALAYLEWVVRTAERGPIADEARRLAPQFGGRL